MGLVGWLVGCHNCLFFEGLIEVREEEREQRVICFWFVLAVTMPGATKLRAFQVKSVDVVVVMCMCGH